MRRFATVLGVLLCVSALGVAEAARPRPMPHARGVLGRALGLDAARVQIQEAVNLHASSQQLVRFSVLVPSVLFDAGVAYVGTARLSAGPSGKAERAQLGSLELFGTGIFSGVHETLPPSVSPPRATPKSATKPAAARRPPARGAPSPPLPGAANL